MAPLFLLLVAGVVVAWLASEFQDRRWLRLLLGCCALALVGGGAGLVGTLGARVHSHAWDGGASGDLIDTTVDALEGGQPAEVLAELKRLRGRFEPTYENRARYDRLVEEYVERVRQGKKAGRPNEWNE